MSPIVLGGIAAAAGGALLLLVGVAAGRWWARREWVEECRHTAIIEERLGHAEQQVRNLQDAAAELREGVDAVWDRAFKAGRETDEWTLISREVQRRQRERGGGRS